MLRVVIERPPTADTERPTSAASPRRVPRALVTAYFAGGLVLLLIGTITVFYLAVTIYDRPRTTAAVLPSAGHSRPTPSVTRSRPGAAVPTSPGPIRNRVGPQHAVMGKTVTIVGDQDDKFEVTVKTGKFRRSGCNEYAVHPKHGGYLPAVITVKVLAGEPDVGVFNFRFERPDGTWLDTVGGSGCDENLTSLMHRVVAGRTYRATAVFDLPADLKGNVIFSYPYLDVAAQWKLK